MREDWKAFRKVGTLCAKTRAHQEHMLRGPERSSAQLEARGRARRESKLKTHEKGNNPSKQCCFNSPHSCVNIGRCSLTKTTQKVQRNELTFRRAPSRLHPLLFLPSWHLQRYLAGSQHLLHIKYYYRMG